MALPGPGPRPLFLSWRGRTSGPRGWVLQRLLSAGSLQTPAVTASSRWARHRRLSAGCGVFTGACAESAQGWACASCRGQDCPVERARGLRAALLRLPFPRTRARRQLWGRVPGPSGSAPAAAPGLCPASFLFLPPEPQHWSWGAHLDTQRFAVGCLSVEVAVSAGHLRCTSSEAPGNLFLLRLVAFSHYQRGLI